MHKLMYPVDTIIMYAKRVDFLLMLNRFSGYVFNILPALGTDIFRNFSIYFASHFVASCNVWNNQYPILLICEVQDYFIMETGHKKKTMYQ